MEYAIVVAAIAAVYLLCFGVGYVFGYFVLGKWWKL